MYEYVGHARSAYHLHSGSDESIVLYFSFAFILIALTALVIAIAVQSKKS